jgi:hypothetical protein
VLDVGCETAVPLDFLPTIHLVGLISRAKPLAANENLDEAIVAAIQTDPLNAYNRIVCWTCSSTWRVPVPQLRTWGALSRAGY